MTSANTDDASLLARLNALRQSPISLDRTGSISPSQATKPSSLRDRFAGLRAASLSSNIARDTSEATAEEGLRPEDIARLGAADGEDSEMKKAVEELGKEPRAGRQDVMEVEGALKDARRMLEESKRREENENQGTNTGEEKAEEEREAAENENEKGPELEAPVTEAEIERLLAELDLDNDKEEDEKEEEGTSEEGDSERLLQLPDTPSKIERRASETKDEAEPAFELPSVPSTAPKSVRGPVLPSVPKPGAQSGPKADADVENWCIICCDDATLKCIGCDGDLYCTTCWNEGHRGEDVGLEERSHRAMAFTAGKKKPKRVLA